MAVSSTVDRSDVAATTQRMTGGDALAEMLIRNGVDTLFGLPGVQLDGFFNALWARQEQAPRHPHPARAGHGLHGRWLRPGQRPRRRLRRRSGPGVAQCRGRAFDRLCLQLAGPLRDRADQVRPDRSRPGPAPRDSRPARHDPPHHQERRTGDDAGRDSGRWSARPSPSCGRAGCGRSRSRSRRIRSSPRTRSRWSVRRPSGCCSIPMPRGWKRRRSTWPGRRTR